MDLMIAAIQIGGKGFVNGLLTLLLIGICAALIFAVGRWFIQKVFKLSEGVMIAWMALFVLVGLVLVINFVMGLTGEPFIRW